MNRITLNDLYVFYGFTQMFEWIGWTLEEPRGAVQNVQKSDVLIPVVVKPKVEVNKDEVMLHWTVAGI